MISVGRPDIAETHTLTTGAVTEAVVPAEVTAAVVVPAVVVERTRVPEALVAPEAAADALASTHDDDVPVRTVLAVA